VDREEKDSAAKQEENDAKLRKIRGKRVKVEEKSEVF
jgi:hypothetical protein